MRCHNSLSSTSFRMSIVFDSPSHRATPSKFFLCVFPLLFSFLFLLLLQDAPNCALSLHAQKPCLLCPNFDHKRGISVHFHQYTLISTFGCPWNLLHSSKKPHFRCLNSFFNSSVPMFRTHKSKYSIHSTVEHAL